MIEWIGIICCTSVISCMCSLLATSFCLSSTGGRFRDSLKTARKTKSQDGLLQCSCFPETAKISQDEETFRGKSPSRYVVPQTSSCIRSHSHFEKDQSTECTENQSKNKEYGRQSINMPKENFNDSPSLSPTVCKNSTVLKSVCCNTPTEIEIRKTIDEFNAVFQQYNEVISRNPRQDLKKSQSSVKFQVFNAYQKTSNVGTMTEQEDCRVFDCKSNSKIKKCKCKQNKTGLIKNVSTQSVKSMKSCTCNIRKSKSDVSPKKTASLKNNRSNSMIKFPAHSKYRWASKSSWISKTMKRLRFKNDRKEKLRCRFSNVNNTDIK